MHLIISLAVAFPPVLLGIAGPESVPNISLQTSLRTSPPQHFLAAYTVSSINNQKLEEAVL